LFEITEGAWVPGVTSKVGVEAPGEPTELQTEQYSEMFDRWIDHQVDITIKNSKAKTSNKFFKNIVNIFPVPTPTHATA